MLNFQFISTGHSILATIEYMELNHPSDFFQINIPQVSHIAKVEIARAYNTIRFQNIYMAQLISGEL
jgi:hypothetical protein